MKGELPEPIDEVVYQICLDISEEYIIDKYKTYSCRYKSKGFRVEPNGDILCEIWHEDNIKENLDLDCTLVIRYVDVVQRLFDALAWANENMIRDVTQ